MSAVCININEVLVHKILQCWTCLPFIFNHGTSHTGILDLFRFRHCYNSFGNILTQSQRGLNTRWPTIVFCLGPTKPRPSYDYASPHRQYSVSLAIYGPMIYTGPYVMLLMQTSPLQGQVGGGWALEIETFFGPCEMASSREAIAIWGPKKSSQGIARPQSQFPYPCTCEIFIYSQDRSTYFPAAE